MNYAKPNSQTRQAKIAGILESVRESLELSPSQFAVTKQRHVLAIQLRKHVAADSARASVEPYPDASVFKGICV